MSQSLGAIHDVAERLGRGSGVIANLSVIGAGTRAPEHRHANPYLWLHVLGGYREAGDAGEHLLDGPAAMFFPAGSAHGMAVGPQALASVIIEYDADWLRRQLGAAVDLHRPRLWTGGETGRRASRLARLWLNEPETPTDRFGAAEIFLAWAMRRRAPPPAPDWLDELGELIDAAEHEPKPGALAEALGVRRSRLARAYRRWRGEGLETALRSRRVAAAAVLIEATDEPLAQIAAGAGFCDQSHMNRCFRQLLGRTPATLRTRRLGFAGGVQSAAA